jgi:tricarballylate dehydrogenase
MSRPEARAHATAPGGAAADVVVVGGGNAALCAALAAREEGARVLLLERAPRAEAGGNSRFTAGAMRFAFDGPDDVHALIPDLSDEERARLDFGSYPEDEFYADMLRITHYRTDPELADLLVTRSSATMTWLRDQGVRFVPNGRQAFEVGGRLRFWGGIVVDTAGGGPGLVEALSDAAAARGVEIWYEARATGLLHDDRGVHGVRVRRAGTTTLVRAGAVVLATGGFEANTEMRTRYLGPGWDVAKVRGTRFNTGDGILMALDAGAMSWGNWSGAHAVPWDQNAPPFGDIRVGDGFSKLSYPLGIMVNAAGERFVDEGYDFRNYTYARYGREVLQQPGSFAWQVFDAKVAHLLRDEYRIRTVTRARADTLEGLAARMEGVDASGFLATVRAFNAAVSADAPFDPSVKDGRSTVGITPAKSNWALAIDAPPFDAYAVTCGLTFTFGGLRITPEAAQVVDTEERAIPGLYAAGELVGGLFYDNYPGGTGLTSGSVFGRLAGAAAARAAAMSGAEAAAAGPDAPGRASAQGDDAG